jgi:regulator of RNase E activity RraA
MTHILPHAVLQELTQIDGPTLANAIEAFKVRDNTNGFASRELRCQFADLKPMVGYAVTCIADSTSPGTARTTRLFDLFDAVNTAPKPVVVVMQAIGPDRSRSCLVGDVLCSIFQKLGAVGVVTDGGFRDLTGIHQRSPGFQVFSPGMVVSHGNSTILDINVTVSVSGLVIQPGDLLHGDLNGVVTVPLSIAERVLEQVKTVWAQEQKLIEYIHSAEFTLDGLKRRMTH